MSNFEIKTGVFIAIFAAFMAVNDLFAGKYGDDEIMNTNNKAAAYQWYQSKSIKQSLAEGESSLLSSLLESNAIAAKSEDGIKNHINKLNFKIKKYEKEKAEILLGSKQVGKENWIQDVDGELGKVIGAKEIEKNLEILGSAGDKFDLATLFFQICLVIGAIAIIIKQEKMQMLFFVFMIVLGCFGTLFSYQALMIAGQIS